MSSEVSAKLSRVDPLSDLDGLISGPRDRARVVNFWASWCGPCREELPMFDAFAMDHSEVEVVLVSVDEAGDRDAVERLLAPIALRSFQLGGDPAALLARAVKDWPGVIPVTLVLDREGVELGRLVGSADRVGLEAILRDMTQPSR
jgi:thiol-disulfide isomerase/thioredoxin